MTRLFPLVPNWASGLTETFEFKTEIQTSRDGSEVRRALRQNPRRGVSYTAMADGDRLNQYDATAFDSIGEVVTFPDYTRHTYLTAALPVDGTTVIVSSVPDWLTAGTTVAIVGRRRVALVEIESVVGLTVQFAAAVDRNWPIGSKLRPVLDGYLKAENQSTLVTNTVSSVPIDFDLVPGIYPMSGGDPGALVSGREVLDIRPNWSSSPAVSYTRDFDTVDYGWGRTANYLPVAYATRSFQATSLLRSASDTRSLRDFFIRQRGCQGEFYVPSWSNDMTLLSAMAGQTGIIVEGRDVFDAYAESTVHRAIWFRMNDGTTLALPVSAITLSGSNTRLTVSALAASIQPQNVGLLCWLYVSRFTSDTLTINWVTDEVATVTLATQSLENLAA